MANISKIISDYNEEVDKTLLLFEKKFGRRDLIRAWREKVIPKDGHLMDGVNYHMHGVGCAVEYPAYDLNFDFCSQNQVGFDAWRLWYFARQFPEVYLQCSKEAIEGDLHRLIDKGSVVPALTVYPGEANSKLYILNG